MVILLAILMRIAYTSPRLGRLICCRPLPNLIIIAVLRGRLEDVMTSRTIDMEALHQQIKSHPRSNEMGMIASHRGLVRATSRSGSPVKGLSIRFDRTIVNSIVDEIKGRPGIIEVVVDFNEGDLAVGDDVMVVLVAGDIRENVFPALIDAINLLKAKAASKEEQIPIE
jgi:molybdopterin synthase catalytic subunit